MQVQHASATCKCNMQVQHASATFKCNMQVRLFSLATCVCARTCNDSCAHVCIYFVLLCVCYLFGRVPYAASLGKAVRIVLLRLFCVASPCLSAPLVCFTAFPCVAYCLLCYCLCFASLLWRLVVPSLLCCPLALIWCSCSCCVLRYLHFRLWLYFCRAW